jgi:hypothetical protein
VLPIVCFDAAINEKVLTAIAKKTSPGDFL